MQQADSGSYDEEMAALLQSDEEAMAAVCQHMRCVRTAQDLQVMYKLTTK